ncbi:CAMK protein kinase [Saprolegnia diclina VS20]|uniref:non-specific serine/threonine protein kinase n=1 Tax=Saprolegnia diclina (strain VS20) TaxID=1156394 RepID=T0PS68_SAPDV|nr:CAMK protein kinase [Saprolegnia diclina VS20]EQC28339.1 CAMK protein kinase [Saprolegnia diclina VS20]|eukprot:XP_008618209.1 CAMK protein kinase [Saprolegnia diclina VS20]
MRVLLDQYEVKHTLGSGLQGKVKLGIDVKTGEAVALKLIKAESLSNKACHNLFREIEAMKRVQHPNVLRLLAVKKDVEYPKKKGGSQKVVLVVLELASGGELFDFMMYTGSFSEEIARTYFRQLVAGLHACHSNNVFHRDIKPENLLMDHSYLLRIADFGLSALGDQSSELLTQCGTRSYMSPEVLSGNPYEGAPADIWSAGVVLFILLAGFPPFQIATRQDWWFRACSMKQYQAFWAAHARTAVFSPMAMDLLTRIFDTSAATRITLPEIWAHPWMHEPVLPDDELTLEMKTRTEKVQAEKMRLQKQKEAAAPTSGTFNPFDRSVHRSFAPAPPTLFLPTIEASGITAYTTLRCVAPSSDDLLRRFRAACEKTSAFVAATWKAGEAKAKFQCATDAGDRVEAALVLHPTDDATVWMAELRRRAGDVFAFRDVFQTLCAGLEDIVCDETKTVATKPLPAPFELSATDDDDDDDGEELISDEAIMI